MIRTLTAATSDSNDKLQADIQKLWKVQHLTANDMFRVFECESCDGSIHVEQRRKSAPNSSVEPNAVLSAALMDLKANYLFDELILKPCACYAKCGEILFYRYICGKLFEATSDGPSCGITLHDDDEHDRGQDEMESEPTPKPELVH